MNTVFKCGRQLMSPGRLRSSQASFGMIVERLVESHSNTIKFHSLENQRRHKSEDSHESIDSGPLMTLAECFKREVESDEPVEPDESFLAMVKAITKSFNIHDEAGKGTITLTRTFQNETIEVVFNCQDAAEAGGQAEDDDDETNGNDEEGIHFKIVISKPDSDKMILDCSAYDQVMIDAVRYIPPGKSVTDDTLYDGPTFDHLDSELQAAFYSYLSDRKIDDDLATFIVNYSREKEQNEYAYWLRQLAFFAAEK